MAARLARELVERETLEGPVGVRAGDVVRFGDVVYTLIEE